MSCAAAALLLLLQAPAQAAPGRGLPRVEPLPLAVRLAAASEPLPLEDFLEAALRFSGTAEQEFAAVKRRLLQLSEEARRALEPISDPRDKAEGILSFLHERVFLRYDERQTRIDVLLETGGYNCVSSGVLYALLAKALGFEVWGARTDDHAFCRVRAGGRSFDVETTSAFGFDPGARKEFTDSFGKVTGYTYVPPSSYRQRTEIGERALLALILYNRSAFLGERQGYLEAVPPAVDAYALLADRESHERMVAAFLNLGSWLGLQGEFLRGVDFLTLALDRHREPRLESLRNDLLHNWTLSLVTRREFTAAERGLDAHRAAGLMSEGEWKSLTVYVYQIKAREAAAVDFAAAAAMVRGGLAKVGPDAALERSFEVYVHNQVVTLIREHRLQDAAAVIDEALRFAPNSVRLKNDRSLVTARLNSP